MGMQKFQIPVLFVASTEFNINFVFHIKIVKALLG